MSRRIYYAAPLFTDAERQWNAANVAALRGHFPNDQVLSPVEFCAAFDAGNGSKPDHAAIFTACRNHLDQATHVVAVLDGSDVDSGTAWEVGYAFAKGLVIVGMRSDWRPGEDHGTNCMLHRSCGIVLPNIAEVCRWLRQHHQTHTHHRH